MGTPEYLHLVGGGIALLAVVVGLYTLAARERKVPYVTNSLYPTFYVVLITIALAIGAGRLGGTEKNTLLNIAAGLLILDVLYVCYRIWRLHHQLVTLRHDQLFKNIPPFSKLRRRRRARSPKDYEHRPIPIGDGLFTSIADSPVLPEEQRAQLRLGLARYAAEGPTAPSPSLLLLGDRYADTDRVFVDLAARCLKSGAVVQYTTCARHPAEFILQLIKVWSSDAGHPHWKTFAAQVVVVDGYTPHFGFTDSTHQVWLQWLKDQGITCIPSPQTYPGIHTATATAFNVTKSRTGTGGRRPALLVYESCSALADLESVEQCRIFLRHLLPSERMWGGMLTMMIEVCGRRELVELIRTYVDVELDLSKVTTQQRIP